MNGLLRTTMSRALFCGITLMGSTLTGAATAPLPLTRVSGQVSFFAAYEGVIGGKGQVPSGQSPMPYLYVCAWDQDGSLVDFKFTEFPQEYGDDDLLGCAKTDADGRFSIPVVFKDSELPDIYLETKLCDDVLRGSHSPADVCVRINAPEGSENTPSNVKVIWSRLYSDVSESSAQITWNLSCPDKSGLGLSSVSCAASELEPDAWDNSCPVNCTSGFCGDTNSRTGCNKEAVHVFRAAIEAYKTWGSNKPNAGSTFSKTCPDSSGVGYCDADSCQDEVKFHLARVQLDPSEDHVTGGGLASCDPSWTDNGAEDYDDICIVSPLNPFRVVHELGHVVDMRWRCDTAGHGNSTGKDGVWERKAVREGFANFFSVAAWFNAGDANPVYCQSGIADVSGSDPCDDVESVSALSGRTAGEEESVTQFFWDLRDSEAAGGSEVDSLRYTLQEIRNILSAFPYGTGDMETREGYDSGDNEDGANIWDFSYHWARKRGISMDYCNLLKADKVDGHERCSACAFLCP